MGEAYPNRSIQPKPVPARFAWITILMAGLCQFPLSSPLRESISQAWIDKLSGHPTETRTPISTLKGWPPSQLEDGTIKQDSTFTCSVAVISTDTAGREEFSSTLLGGPSALRTAHINTQDCSWCCRIADDIRDCHFYGTALFLLFSSGVFYRLLLNKHNTNINHASVAEAD